MSKLCFNCGTENAEEEKFCRRCGANIGDSADMQQSGIQAGTGEERVLWDNGELQLTTEAVLIGSESSSPDVVPLEVIQDVVLKEGCLVLKVKDGNDRYCMLEDPRELAALVREQVLRPRLAQRRKEPGQIAPD